MKESEREGEREKERERKKEREREREGGEREREREREREGERERERERERQTDRQRQTERERDREQEVVPAGGGDSPSAGLRAGPGRAICGLAGSGLAPISESCCQLTAQAQAGRKAPLWRNRPACRPCGPGPRPHARGGQPAPGCRGGQADRPGPAHVMAPRLSLSL